MHFCRALRVACFATYSNKFPLFHINFYITDCYNHSNLPKKHTKALQTPIFHKKRQISMFYNANLYKVGLKNSQRHGCQRSTSVTFSTPEIPGAAQRFTKFIHASLLLEINTIIFIFNVSYMRFVRISPM